MASPFTIFRKHQRVMMAVLGMAAMIAFVFLGPLQELMSQRSQKDPVIATSIYGKVRESDLRHMHEMRNVANQFIARAAIDAQIPYFGNQYFGEANEQSLVQTMLLANKAKEMGVVISDQFITDWLERTFQRRVTSKQYEGIVAAMQTSRPQVYDALRTELQKLQLVEMSFPGFIRGESLAQECAIFSLYNTTPAQRWEYFQRLKRQASIEALAVRAEDFISEIAEPSDDVIASFYAKHKDAEPQPGSPEPGFKIPPKVKLDYFVAEKKNFTNLALVTDDEIKNYYEENKGSLYLFDMWPRFEPKEKALEPPSAPGTAAPGKGESPAKSDAKPTDTKPGEKKAEETKSGETPKTDAPKSDLPKSDTPKPEAPKSDAPKAQAPGSNGAASRLAPTSMLAQVMPAPFSLLSAGFSALSSGWHVALFADDPKTPPTSAPAGAAKETKPADEKAADTPASKDAAADKAPTAKSDSAKSEPAKSDPAKKAEPAAPPKDDAGKTEKSADTKPADTKGAPGKSDADKAPAEKPFAPPAATTELPVSFLPLSARVMVSDDDILPRQITDFPAYLPLKYVAESIREALAEQRAPERIAEALDAVSAKMKRYGSERTRWEVRRQDNKEMTPPEPLDLKALAEQYKLTLHETDLVTPYEASRLPGIGESYTGSPQYPRFVSLVFSQFPLLTPSRSVDLRAEFFFLFWKTESQESRVPELSEIRGEVVRAWKMNEARPRTMKQAESLAAEARKEGRSLKALFGERPKMQVIETEPFSWLTQDNTADFSGQIPPKLNEIPGILDAGNDFMHKVFSLNVGDVGVSFNNPQSIAYVIRPTNFQPSTKFLEDLFMITPLPQYSAAAALDRQQMMIAWNQAMQKEAELEWAPGRLERQSNQSE